MVLAYSGGLDTSIILKWLQDEYGCEARPLRLPGPASAAAITAPSLTQVITFTADLGQGEELEPARAKAQLMGVKQARAAYALRRGLLHGQRRLDAAADLHR